MMWILFFDGYYVKYYQNYINDFSLIIAASGGAVMKKKLNELEFWGVQYTYELYMNVYKDDVRKTFDALEDRWGKNVVKAYKMECRKRFGHCVNDNGE